MAALLTVTFALAGLANLGSIAILTGGIAPQRRDRIAEFGLRAVLAASPANLVAAP